MKLSYILPIIQAAGSAAFSTTAGEEQGLWTRDFQPSRLVTRELFDDEWYPKLQRRSILRSRGLQKRGGCIGKACGGMNNRKPPTTSRYPTPASSDSGRASQRMSLERTTQTHPAAQAQEQTFVPHMRPSLERSPEIRPASQEQEQPFIPHRRMSTSQN